ncbi:hypothetical protein GW17_00031031 [Ensete ventricosum]|nr:hypothetical protein GW17_00031031 [Ensete ventricosum]
MDYGPSVPPPSPPLFLQPFPLAVEPDHLPSATSSSSSSFSPSLLIIAAIVACVCVASVSIHVVLRLLFSSRRSSSVAAASLLVSSRSTSASVTSTADPSSDPVKSALIDSLPVFNLSSSLATLSKSSPDCAVCLRPFGPDEDLRLLPACRHAFHSGCVEPWIRKSPSCPLCRAPVTLPPPPLPSVPSHTPCDDPPMSRSFDVEIGGASRPTPGDVLSRGNPSLPTPQSSSSLHQTYSIGLSLDHMMNEEEADVEAVVHRIPRRQDADSAASGPAPAGEEAAGPTGGGSRGWLMDYVDRLSSSSFRFSGRWGQLFDDEGGGWHSAELEGTARRETEEEEDGGGGLAALYRWITGGIWFGFPRYDVYSDAVGAATNEVGIPSKWTAEI